MGQTFTGVSYSWTICEIKITDKIFLTIYFELTSSPIENNKKSLAELRKEIKTYFGLNVEMLEVPGNYPKQIKS